MITGVGRARRRRLPTSSSTTGSGSMDWTGGSSSREWLQPHPQGFVQSTITFYSGVAPERCLKISTAILSACRCSSNDDISNSIRAIVAINPPSTTGGSLLGLAGTSSGAATGLFAAPAPAPVLLRYCLDHLRNDQMLTPSSLARWFADTPSVCNRCTASTLKFSSTFFRVLGITKKVPSCSGRRKPKSLDPNHH